MARLSKRFTLFVVALLAASGPASAMTLAEAVRIATERDPAIAALQMGVARETTNILAARDARLPQLSISGDTSSLDNDDGDTGLTVTVSQVLFDWGLTRSRIDAASFQRVQVVADMKMEVEDLALEVSELFIDVEVSNAKIASTQTYVDFARRIEDFSRSRVEAGLSDSAEIARAMLEIARAEERMAQLTSNRLISLAQLEFLLGLPVAEPQAPPRITFTERFANSAAVISAVTIAPEYISAKAEVDIAEAGIVAARASTRPTIRLQARGRQDLNGGRGRSGAIGLTAGVDLDAGAFRGRAITGAQQDLAAAESELRGVERDLQNAVRTYRENIEVLSMTEASQQTQLSRAREVLDAYEEQFIGGRRELIDVLTTARDLYEAEISEIDTYDERKRTEYTAAHAVGMLGSLLFEASRRSE